MRSKLSGLNCLQPGSRPFRLHSTDTGIANILRLASRYCALGTVICTAKNLPVSWRRALTRNRISARAQDSSRQQNCSFLLYNKQTKNTVHHFYTGLCRVWWNISLYAAVSLIPGHASMQPIDLAYHRKVLSIYLNLSLKVLLLMMEGISYFSIEIRCSTVDKMLDYLLTTFTWQFICLMIKKQWFPGGADHAVAYSRG